VNGETRGAWQNFWDGAAPTTPNGTPGAARLPVVLDLAEQLMPVWVDALGGARPVVSGMASQLLSWTDAGTDVVLQDGSPVALQAAGQLVAGAQTLCSDFSGISLPDDSVSLALSQFGVEYGGGEAMRELERVAQNRAVFLAVVHKKGGAIERDSASNRGLIDRFLETNLLKLTPQLFQAAFDHHAGRISDADYLVVDQQVAPAMEAVRDLVNQTRSEGAANAGLATITGLVSDIGGLHERFGEYRLDDLLGWLSGWQYELTHYTTRMGSMLAAAMDSNEIEQWLDHWQPANDTEPLFRALADADDQDYAWLVQARRA